MAEPIRFYMDQHFPRPASYGLRRHGLDVLTSQEAGRCGSSDSKQLAYATADERAIVTFDTDFLALHQAAAPHCGVLWCQEQKYTVGQLIRALLLVHGALDRDDMRNHVEYLEVRKRTVICSVVSNARASTVVRR